MTNKKKIKIFNSTSELVGLTDKEVDDSIDYQIESEGKGLKPGNALKVYLNDKDIIEGTLYDSSVWGPDIEFNPNEQKNLNKDIINYIKKLVDNQDTTHIAASKEELDKIPHSKDLKIEKLYGTKVTQTYMVKNFRIEGLHKNDSGTITLRFYTPNDKDFYNVEDKDYCLDGDLHKFEGCYLCSRLDFDYDNPDKKMLYDYFRKDYASRILTLFRETPFGMHNNEVHYYMYDIFKKKFEFELDDGQATVNIKFFDNLLGICDYDNVDLDQYIADYIKDYMKHNYIGRDVKVPTRTDVYYWLGADKMPIVSCYYSKSNSGNTYVLARLSN